MNSQNDHSDSQKSKFEEAAEEFGRDAKKAAHEFREEWNEVRTSTENKKVLCGVLAILLGGLGVHKFLLGYNTEGVLHILLTFLCGIGAIIGIVEGIIYLTKTDEEFYQTYQIQKKGWF
ncbi:MAG: TM2 domain-containing protein [Flavobacteriaceae bacterium]|nr:TM2 domain-containing protein [Flavobacteriaceae bacterium]